MKLYSRLIHTELHFFCAVEVGSNGATIIYVTSVATWRVSGVPSAVRRHCARQVHSTVASLSIPFCLDHITE